MENIQTLHELCRVLRNKYPWKKTIILLHDSARPNTVRQCMDRIRMKCWNLSTIYPTGWPGLRTAVCSGL